MVRIFHREEVLANADRLQVTACHCEERSDAAIRIPAEILGKQVLLRANSWRFSYSPKVVLCVLRCRKENGLPHQCAHWFAMTCRRRAGVRGCKDAVHDDRQKTGTRSRG